MFSLINKKRICNYCKCGNFRENFLFPNSVKRHIRHVQYSLLGHDLPTSVMFTILRGLYFHERFHENKTRIYSKMFSYSRFMKKIQTPDYGSLLDVATPAMVPQFLQHPSQNIRQKIGAFLKDAKDQRPR